MAEYKLIDKTTFLLPKMEFFPVSNEGGLFFRELTGESLLEYKEYVEHLQKEADGDDELKPHQAIDLMVKFIVLSACDERGRLVFDADDIPALREKSPNLLMDMANFAMPISGISSQSVSEVAVNLKNDLPDSSITDLPTNFISQ